MQDKLNIVWGYSLVAKSIIRSFKLNIDGPWVRFSVSPIIFAIFPPLLPTAPRADTWGAHARPRP
jgi:hypothetical protein